MTNEPESIPTEWLGEMFGPVTAASKFTSSPSPFVIPEAEWKQLFLSLLPDDEVWSFCSPPDSWQHLAGRSGIVVLRAGKVVKTLTLLMN